MIVVTNKINGLSLVENLCILADVLLFKVYAWRMLYWWKGRKLFYLLLDWEWFPFWFGRGLLRCFWNWCVLGLRRCWVEWDWVWRGRERRGVQNLFLYFAYIIIQNQFLSRFIILGNFSSIVSMVNILFLSEMLARRYVPSMMWSNFILPLQCQ